MGLVFSIQTRGGATESAQDNRISTHIIQLLTKDGSPVALVRYGQNLRTTYFAPWTVPYLRSIFEAYRTITKKAYRAVLFIKNLDVPYRIATLAFSYSQL